MVPILRTEFLRIAAGLLVLPFAWAPASALASALNGLHTGSWEIRLEANADTCILQQELPRYGVARFIGIPGQALRFQIRPVMPLEDPDTAALVLEPPPWRKDLEPQSLGEVRLRAGPTAISVGGSIARALYHGLERGFAVRLGDSGSHLIHRPDDPVFLPMGFSERLLEFSECAGPLPPFDFVSIEEWQIPFDLDSVQLDRSANLEIRRIAHRLRDNPGTRVIVIGHADLQGDPRYNQTLSLRRAEAVRRVLEAEGLPRDRIRIQGFGDTRPLRLGEDEVDLQANRRVEIWWVDATGESL